MYLPTGKTLFCLSYNNRCWNKLLHLFYDTDYLMAHKHVQNSPVFQTARQIIITKRTTRQYSWNRVTSSGSTYNNLLWSYCTKTTSIRRFFACLVSRCLYFLSRPASFLKEANDYSVSFRKRPFTQYWGQDSANRDMWKIINCAHFPVCFFLVY